MRLSLSPLLALLSLLSLAAAQVLLTSTIDVPDGDTVVVSRTTNRLGAVTYATISTVQPGAGGAAVVTTPTTRATTTAAAATTTQPRVVGQENTSTRPNTVFQYTTTDAGGNKVVRTATFTPSFAPTTVTFKPAEGTTFNYGEYTAKIGPSLSAQYVAASRAAANAASGGSTRVSLLSGASAGSLALAGALVGAGALFVGLA